MKFKTSDHYYATVMEMKGKFLGSVDGDAFRDAIQTLRSTPSATLSGLGSSPCRFGAPPRT